MLPLIRQDLIKGVAHITGGGLTDNTPRMLPDHLKPEYDLKAWERPDVFKWLQKTGGIEEAEMQRAFNCGIGLVLAVDETNMMAVLENLSQSGETPYVIGQLIEA